MRSSGRRIAGGLGACMCSDESNALKLGSTR